MFLGLNYFEGIILFIVFILIASLMNMFPICRWLAKKMVGSKEATEKSPMPEESSK